MNDYCTTELEFLVFLFAAPAVIDPGANVTTDGVVSYFQTSCSTFSGRVLIELIDVRGTSFLFGSSTVNNPGPLTSNTQSNTTRGINRRTITVTLRSPKV